MLFNSFEYIFVFLPLAFLVYRALNSFPIWNSHIWLICCSLFFYSWWNPPFVVLLIVSILFNYSVAIAIQNNIGYTRKFWLSIGVAVDLALIGYYKYFAFLAENICIVLGYDVPDYEFFLPLAISFFTFQQIAFLVDTSKDKDDRYNLREYTLFVCFFPQLIAGPILHHSQILPQFKKRIKFNIEDICVGLTVFSIGLFKKIVIADTLAIRSDAGFSLFEVEGGLSFVEAWVTALSYTFQLYFDFSGYSDMAIGAARLFGIHLPINFFSPYRSQSIIDFWRRWHITLSHFLRDYVYIPLGGSRSGEQRHLFNLFLTMFLGGLWHGAGWTFIVWGALHGLLLIINHLWIRFNFGEMFNKIPKSILSVFYRFITFLCIVVGWVFFRSPDVLTALNLVSSMFSFEIADRTDESIVNTKNIVLLLGAYVISVSFPNVYQFMSRFFPNLSDVAHGSKVSEFLQWKLNAKLAVFAGVLFAISIVHLTRVSQFLYFQF